MPLQSSQAAHLRSGIFVEHFSLPARDRMGQLLCFTLRLGPGPHVAQGVPCLSMRKILPSHIDRAIFSSAIKLKRTPPFCIENGSHLQRATLLAMIGIKNSTHATHLRLKSLSPASTTTSSNFQSTTNVQLFSAPNERNRATVNVCDLERDNFGSRRFLGLAHDGRVANSACASAISGNSGVGLKPSSAELRMDFASVARAID